MYFFGWTRHDPNQTRSVTESKSTNSNCPIGSKYLRLDPTRTREDPNRPEPRILNYQSGSKLLDPLDPDPHRHDPDPTRKPEYSGLHSPKFCTLR